MGRWANYPTPIEDLRSFDISFLSKYQYCKPNQIKSGTITWTSPYGGKNSIGIKVKTNDKDATLNLDYTFNKTIPINYKTLNLFHAPQTWELVYCGFSFVLTQVKFAENYT